MTLRYQTDSSIVTAGYDVSFDFYRGDRFILLGASGCGKSSLLKAVGGFLKPASGRSGSTAGSSTLRARIA